MGTGTHIVVRRSTGEWAVVWRDGHVVDFEDPSVSVSALADQVAASGRQASRPVKDHTGRVQRLVARPVRPPLAIEPWAVQVLVGSGKRPCGDPRPLGAAIWDHHEMHTVVTRQFHALSSSARPFRRVLPGSTITAKLVESSVEETLLTAGLHPPATPDHFQGEMTVLHDDGHLMRWQIVVVVDSSSRHTLRAVCHDISDVKPPRIDCAPNQPVGDQYGLLTFPADGAPPRISQWSRPHETDAMHEAQPGRCPGIHPDDQPFLTLMAELAIASLADARSPRPLRFEHGDGTWTTNMVRTARSPAMGPARHRIVYIELLQTGAAEADLQSRVVSS